MLHNGLRGAVMRQLEGTVDMLGVGVCRLVPCCLGQVWLFWHTSHVCLENWKELGPD